jgi:hypothetical protein
MSGRIAGIPVAFLGGAAAWVLPPHVLGRIVDHYPYTVWPWLGDAVWNVVPSASMLATIVIGFIYGFLDPKYWYVAFLTTWWVFPFNIALDVTSAPTSHNLFPIELIIFAFWNLPALGAACLGMRVRDGGLEWLDSQPRLPQR